MNRAKDDPADPADALADTLAGLIFDTTVKGNKGKPDKIRDIVFNPADPTFYATVKGNKGEMAEIRTIQTLLRLPPSDLVTLFGNDARDGINLYTAARGNKVDVIVKSIATSKPLYISIKSRDGGSCSVLNTTNRLAPVFQPDGYMHIYLPILDRIMRSRTARLITRDQNPAAYTIKGKGIKTYIPGYAEDQSPYEMGIEDHEKIAILHLLRYFIFLGTGQGDSGVKVDSILTVVGDDPSNWIFTQVGPTEAAQLDYAKSVYDIARISTRKKGSLTFVAEPTDPTDTKKMSAYKEYLSEMEVCEPWAYGEKGALNIRLKYTR